MVFFLELKLKWKNLTQYSPYTFETHCWWLIPLQFPYLFYRESSYSLRYSDSESNSPSTLIKSHWHWNTNWNDNNVTRERGRKDLRGAWPGAGHPSGSEESNKSASKSWDSSLGDKIQDNTLAHTRN